MITENELRNLLGALLRKRRRRLPIVLRWNRFPPARGETLREVLRHFIETLLWHPVELELHEDRLVLFGYEHRALSVLFKWMTANEQAVVGKMWEERESLFETHAIYKTGNFRLSRCTIASERLLPVAWRRQLVRDFAWYACERPDVGQSVRLSLLLATQDLLARGDPFVGALHHGLQRGGVLEEALAWENFAHDAEYP